MDFYSGNGTWSMVEQQVENSVYIYPVVNISTTDGRKASLEFGTVLEYIEFVPINKPKEINWVTFQKCPPRTYITDDFLEPLVKALSQSPRDTLGFSPITTEDRIEMDTDGLIGKTDVWLHAYNDFSSHDILLKLHNQEYIWVHEQESFGGPATWVDSDASTWQETITLQYQIEQINGGPLNLLTIDYIGPDQRLQNTSKNWYFSNNLNDVLPILEEWRQWRASEPPSPQALCP
jgi:hypothetical protein